MVSERKRAVEKGYESPINDTIEATHAMYNEGLSFVLHNIAEGQKAEVLVASHNQVGW